MNTIDHILDPGVIAIVRSKIAVDVRVASGLLDALAQGGIRAVELTLTTPGALDTLERLGPDVRSRLALGMGSVLTVEQAQSAIAVGAKFIVTPVQKLDIVKFCNTKSVPVVCGAYTPSEAQAAHEAGADFVKLFPAEGLGPAYVKSLLAPLPHLRVIPTGGVTAETVGPFFRAGCVAVAAGSSLVSEELLASQDRAALTLRARTFVENAREH